MILVAGCANVGSLPLALSRENELKTRLSLRAGVVEASRTLPPEFGPLYYNVTADLRIFAYVSAISLVAAMLFGLVPALESSRGAL